VDIVISKIIPNSLRAYFQRKLVQGIRVMSDCMTGDVSAAANKTTYQAAP
jgi:hypothetical protein